MRAGADIRWLVLLLVAPVLAKTGDEQARHIAEEVYFVNHFFAVDNISYGSKRHPMQLINLPTEGKAQRYRLERHLNNVYDRGDIRARDLVIFRSGKLRSTGILVDIYKDRRRPLSFAIWLPVLRKIRRHAEPDPADIWGGSIFTYGDIYLRRPEDENHTLLGKIRFPGCLGLLDPAPDGLQPSCAPKGKEVFHLRSTNRNPNWWYDYRDQYIDTESYADYRAEYYRDGKRIKIIDKDWRSMNLTDPRAQYWRYWYGKDLRSGAEGLAWIKDGQVSWNDRVSRNLWSLATLRKLSR
ncbi:outer membrane lipoprotein-sorting protein [Thiolapillus sp.]